MNRLLACSICSGSIGVLMMEQNTPAGIVITALSAITFMATYYYYYYLMGDESDV